MAWLKGWTRLALGMSALVWLLILALMAASGLAPRRQIAFTVTLARNSEIYTLPTQTACIRSGRRMVAPSPTSLTDR